MMNNINETISDYRGADYVNQNHLIRWEVNKKD